MPTRHKFQTVDEYIGTFPKETQDILEEIRKLIKSTAPEDAEEKISYNIPSFQWHGYLIYFAGYEHHIGVYPTPPGDEKFEKLISPYVKGKGTLQFPLNKSIPYDVIKEVVKWAVKRNEVKVKLNK